MVLSFLYIRVLHRGESLHSTFDPSLFCNYSTQETEASRSLVWWVMTLNILKFRLFRFMRTSLSTVDIISWATRDLLGKIEIMPASWGTLSTSRSFRVSNFRLRVFLLLFYFAFFPHLEVVCFFFGGGGLRDKCLVSRYRDLIFFRNTSW